MSTTRQTKKRAPAISAAALFFILASCTGSADHSASYAGYDFERNDTGRRNTYAAYRNRHSSAAPAGADIPVDIFAYAAAADVEELPGSRGNPGRS
jgi:hypothetical protein